MDFIYEIKDETLIICSNAVKQKILEMHLLKPIRIMTLQTFIHSYLFNYDEKAILFIMNKYQVKYDVALEYIRNLYYIENKQYNISKLDFLVNLKNELDDNKLLIYNNDFRNYVKRIKIVLYDINIDDYLINILNGLNYQIIAPVYNNYSHVIYEAETLEEEVNYVAKEIAKLIYDGIDPAKIKLTNVDKSYYNMLNRIFGFYNLKVNIPYRSKLSVYPIVKEFLSRYQTGEDISLILEDIKEDTNIFNELVKVINENIKYDNRDLISYKISNSFITSEQYDNGIDIINYLDYVCLDDEYIFMLGFNEGIIPNYYMDTDYITDNIKDMLYMDKTDVLNRKLTLKIRNVIGNIKNLIITYKLRDNVKEYYPSVLTSDYEVIKIDDDVLDSYSAIYDKIRLVRGYDQYFKFGYENNLFSILRNNYSLKYNSFDNKYKKIDRVMDKLNLSYSKMQVYNKCAFRYYLADILKLDIFLENFSTVIGSMVHYVMEKCLSNNDMDVNKYVYEYLGDREFSKKEKFFLNKYIEAIHDLLRQVLLEREYSLFNQAMYEKKIDIDFGSFVHFVGIIDKVLYYIDENTTYVCLIDYKTGNDNISLDYLKYGLDIQLPIYLYLVSKLDFKNVRYTGFYLQKFNISNGDYRLVGYSNSDKNVLSVADNGYDNSKVIKGLKTLKDGSFAKTSRVLSDEEIHTIIGYAEEKITEVIEKIKSNDFTINPKVCDNVNIGCEYCKFKDICFKKVNDEITIYKEEFGGEI